MDWKDRCWVCGTKKNVTGHHVLPKGMKPKKNRKIPLCDDCHREYNYFYAAHTHITSGHRLSKYNELNSTVQEVLTDNVELANQITVLRMKLGNEETEKQEILHELRKKEFVYIPKIKFLPVAVLIIIIILLMSI